MLLNAVIPAEVAFVPPLATGSAVPEYAIAKVPVVVIGEPVTEKILGAVKATLVTPELLGVAQLPSPRQNVVADALVPLFKLVTGKFPVTPVVSGSPVPFVKTIAEGVPKSPPLISSVPVASGQVIVGVPAVAAACSVCVPTPDALP